MNNFLKRIIFNLKNITIVLLTILVIVMGWLLIVGDKTIESIEPECGVLEDDNNKHFKDATIGFEFIESENQTWGYKILLEGSPLIVQPNKPGLPGNEGFKTKEDAQRVAELVISKIREGQMPPTVTIEELRELGVL